MQSFKFTFLAITLILAAAVSGAQDKTIEGLLQQAAQAAQHGEHDRAIARLTQVIESDPKESRAWYLRGRENFRAGKIEAAVTDFDKYVELVPAAANQQWERGIAYYYAGEYAKGAKQFEDYQKYHDQDVENSVWRYLCVARTDGVEKARATLLPITNDARIPMMKIYELYQAKAQPDEVIAAAQAGSPIRELENLRLFYAHLYIGLWHEAAGDAEQAKKYILESEKHKIGHYMWDVAHVHAERLRRNKK